MTQAQMLTSDASDFDVDGLCIVGGQELEYPVSNDARIRHRHHWGVSKRADISNPNSRRVIISANFWLAKGQRPWVENVSVNVNVKTQNLHTMIPNRLSLAAAMFCCCSSNYVLGDEALHYSLAISVLPEESKLHLTSS